MGQKLNFVIAGCGNIAIRHAAAITHCGRLLAVCDSNPLAAAQLARQYDCAAYTSLDQMLREQDAIDVVSICTPNWLHAPQSILCMQHGFHVLCEKPMAISAADAKNMIEVSEATGKTLFIVKQLRQYPHLIRLKAFIDSCRPGYVTGFRINCCWNRDNNYYRDWRGRKKTDGGTLYTQFSHYIDLMIWLFGAVKKFHFTSDNMQHPYIEFEDCGQLRFTMAAGFSGSFNYSVNADKDKIENEVSLFTRDGNTTLSGAFLENIHSTGITAFNITDTENSTDKSKSHFKVYGEVTAALKGKTNTATTGADSIQSIQLIETIYNSLQL
ncbi:MAG: Gfo/Idh/MocA family oxidoreductase [Niabella sp.]